MDTTKDKINSIINLANKLDRQFMKKIFESEMNPNLTFNQFYYLYRIKELQPITASALAENIHISKASTSIMLKKLEGKGFIQSLPSIYDKRERMIRTTEAGDGVIEGGRTFDQVFASFLKNQLSEHEIEVLEIIMGKFQKHSEDN